MTNPYLGAVTRSGLAPPVYTQLDNKQHPYFRTEMLQKAMNLTTVRTHQYAVWITVGFFEVTRQGDLLMISSPAPWLAFDILGPELALQRPGNPVPELLHRRPAPALQVRSQHPDSFRPAVVYRQTIE